MESVLGVLALGVGILLFIGANLVAVALMIGGSEADAVRDTQG